MHATHEYKNNIFTWLFCQVFGNRAKHKLQQKNCGSYFLNITKSLIWTKMPLIGIFSGSHGKKRWREKDDIARGGRGGGTLPLMF